MNLEAEDLPQTPRFSSCHQDHLKFAIRFPGNTTSKIGKAALVYEAQS